MLNERGYIYTSKHEGWYSVNDETFYPESAVKLVLDPATGRKFMVGHHPQIHHITKPGRRLLRLETRLSGALKIITISEFQLLEIVFLNSTPRTLTL